MVLAKIMSFLESPGHVVMRLCDVPSNTEGVDRGGLINAAFDTDEVAVRLRESASNCTYEALLARFWFSTLMVWDANEDRR